MKVSGLIFPVTLLLW